MFRLLPLLLLMPCLAGCSPQYTILEHRDIALPVGESPTLLIEMVNGPIAITTASCRDITGKVTKRGVGHDKEDAEKELAGIDFDFLPNQNGKVVIKVKRVDGNKHWNSSGAEASLQVPEGSTIELVTSNGHIEINGKNRGTQARTKNGAVTVKNVEAPVDIVTSNGSVQCEAVQGPVKIETSNASVTIQGRNMLLDCKSSNGSVRCAGNLIDGEHHVITSNGHITMTLPRDISLNLDASTSNGKINNDFSLVKLNFGLKKTKTAIQGSIGNSEPGKTLTLKTTNGSVSIKRDKKSSDVVQN